MFRWIESEIVFQLLCADHSPSQHADFTSGPSCSALDSAVTRSGVTGLPVVSSIGSLALQVVLAMFVALILLIATV